MRDHALTVPLSGVIHELMQHRSDQSGVVLQITMIEGKKRAVRTFRGIYTLL